VEHYDFREIVEHLPLVVYVDELDEKSTPIYVSPQIERLLGYTAAEWVADPELYLSSIHPEDRERVLAEIASRNLSIGAAPSYDYRLVGRDGKVIWVRDDEIVVTDDSGAPVAVHGYLQDVTDRRNDKMRLELLAGILGLAAEDRRPGEIVTEAARMLAAAVGDVNVTFVDIGEDGRLRARYSTEHNGPVLDTLAIPGYLELLESGPIVVDNVAAADWLSDVQDALEVQKVGSAVDVPLRRDGQIVGVLWFNTSGPRRWLEHEVTVLSEVTEQLATVLANAEAREERRRAERDLRSRDVILGAVSRAAEHFLKQPVLDDAMVDLMRVLGQATAASRAYVFENLPDEGPVPYCFYRAGWDAGAAMPMIDDPRLGLVHPSPHFSRWAEILGSGEALSAHVRELPQDEREALELVEALSIVAVPIFVEGEWWGFIGFEDCERERDWSAAETDALRAAAGLVSAGISSERAQRDLRRRDAILEAVSNAAERLVAEPVWRDAIDDLLERLGLAAETSRAYLFECGRRADGKWIASQRNEWVAAGITAELGNPLMQDMCFEEVGLARFQEIALENELYTGNAAYLPRAERELLEAQGIRSIATVPIYVEGVWWGFIGFDDCLEERKWSAAELDALRAAASLVSAAIGRERSEVTLREHEQKLRAIFDTTLDAIFITDDERRYVDVNPAACDLIGVAKRDLIGRRVDEFLPPERREQVRATWDDYVRGGPVQEEWETMRPDGTVIVSEASARPNFLPGLHMAFLRDITERKRLESELLSAQKLESLGRLAGGVAHDFNNLLTGIIGYASLLLERANGDGELSRDLNEIVRAADRAAELTKQLLAFGRRQVLKPRALDLNLVLDGVDTLLGRLLGESIELVIHRGADLGTVRADPGQIEQVIVNLAVNAKHAMTGGGRLTIETRNAGSDAVEFVFSDTGVGMDDETLGRIFEPFFTTREDGVGLGLASVHGIVHQSGGELSVDSVPGGGTTFIVRLPRVAEVPGSENLPAPPEAEPGSETILLVEDEDVVRDLTRRVLERQGYTVLACSHGEEAVALAASDDNRIDLLLTDVVMPGLRGYEVAQQVALSRPEIKILYMSGYAEEALVGRPALAGHTLIEKPFAVDALTRHVREALDAA
jgi:two-component system, cell cycle sensor histidine kinase and response regulator CckA